MTDKYIGTDCLFFFFKGDKFLRKRFNKFDPISWIKNPKQFVTKIIAFASYNFFV